MLGGLESGIATSQAASDKVAVRDSGHPPPVSGCGSWPCSLLPQGAGGRMLRVVLCCMQCPLLSKREEGPFGQAWLWYCQAHALRSSCCCLLSSSCHICHVCLSVCRKVSNVLLFCPTIENEDCPETLYQNNSFCTGVCPNFCSVCLSGAGKCPFSPPTRTRC